MSTVKLENLTKIYGETIAVDKVSLTVGKGELVSLLGPSGCGKTTTLRMLAGLVSQTEGRIWIGELDATTWPASRRGVAMVFQDYALFPHMTVYDNVAFGLRIRSLDNEVIRRRVEESLELVALVGLEKRYPGQLSGGQQQRVALARSIAIQPKVLLLDEPLSNLDAQLREQMRHEIRDLQKELNLTTVYVTHDQEEALAISDRVAVMNRGQLIQLGTPLEVYQRPSGLFVAEFVGHANLIRGTVIDDTAVGTYVKTEAGWLVKSAEQGVGLRSGHPVTVLIRPEFIRARKCNVEPGNTNCVEGVVKDLVFLGAFSRLFVRIPQHGPEILVDYLGTQQHEGLRIGDGVTLRWNENDVRVIPEADGFTER